MPDQEAFPSTYRLREITAIHTAVRAGECVSIVGLSGAGKSNLLRYLAGQSAGLPAESVLPFVLIDCNRLSIPATEAFFRLVRSALGCLDKTEDPYYQLSVDLQKRLQRDGERLCLLLDRFDSLLPCLPVLSGNLRALRDDFKFRLTYVTATRRPLDGNSELAELFFANTIWLGPLNEADARWNIERYASRYKARAWDEETIAVILKASWGYPALLKAACEAHALGAPATFEGLAAHPAIQRRVAEFWADNPSAEALQYSGLTGQPLLEVAKPAGTAGKPAALSFDTALLTAKEHLLLGYLQQHPEMVCEKDDLIQAIWPEDRIFERGVRDDSLAQLVRRLREKIEVDPSSPQHILTVPGRGYRFKPG